MSDLDEGPDICLTAPPLLLQVDEGGDHQPPDGHDAGEASGSVEVAKVIKDKTNKFHFFLHIISSVTIT